MSETNPASIAFYIARASIISVGLVGNIVSFIVFSRSIFIKNSISTYCRALAFVDCFTLNQLITDIGLIFFNYYLPETNSFTCKTFYYISIAFSSMPSWFLVVFSLDKMLGMKKIPKFDFIKNRKFQYTLLFGIVLIQLVLYADIPVLLDVKISENNTQVCDIANMLLVSIIDEIYLLEASIIPFVIMTGSSAIMINLIIRSRKSIEHLGHSSKKRKRRDIKFAITSLTFNVLFVCLRVPLVVYYSLVYYGIDLGYYYYMSTILLFFVNSSISFFVHFLSNSVFRKQLFVILKLRNLKRELTQNNAITVHPMQSTT